MTHKCKGKETTSCHNTSHTHIWSRTTGRRSFDWPSRSKSIPSNVQIRLWDASFPPKNERSHPEADFAPLSRTSTQSLIKDPSLSQRPQFRSTPPSFVNCLWGWVGVHLGSLSDTADSVLWCYQFLPSSCHRSEWRSRTGGCMWFSSSRALLASSFFLGAQPK